MTDPAITPKTLMPKWWQAGTTVLLYAAYLLWLIPLVAYFRNGADLLTAGMWLAGVIVIQFGAVKGIALVEYLATANKIERLSDEENVDFSRIGDPK